MLDQPIPMELYYFIDAVSSTSLCANQKSSSEIMSPGMQIDPSYIVVQVPAKAPR